MRDKSKKSTHKPANHAARFTIITIFIFLVAFGIHCTGENTARTGILAIFERLYIDYKLKNRASRQPPPSVAIIGIGEESLMKLGRFPFHRGHYADLIARVEAAGAKVLAFDILFSEPEQSRARMVLEDLLRKAPKEIRTTPGVNKFLKNISSSIEQEDGDRRFAAQIANSSMGLVFGYRFNLFVYGDHLKPSRVFSNLSKEDRARELAKRKLLKDRPIPIAWAANFRNDSMLSSVYAGAEPILPMAELFTSIDEQKRNIRLGFFNAIFDYDGILRQAPLLVHYQNAIYPSLALSAAALYLNRESSIQGKIGRQGVESLVIPNAEEFYQPIATDEAGRAWVNYYGNKASPSLIPTYEFSAVLDGTVGAKELAGKVLFVGTTEETLGDNKAIPIDASFPGVEVNASVAANLIEASFLYQYQYYFWFGVFLLTLGAFLLYKITLRLNPFIATVFLLTLIGSILWLDQKVFFAKGQILPALWAVTEYVVIFIGLIIYKFASIERDKRFIHAAFSRFVSYSVAEEILRDPAKLKIGGEKCEVTVLFSDIVNFTEIAEKIDAELVSNYLNAYFTFMTRIVLENRGTLDKYIGDSIMCFWGAPLREPRHAELAARTALAMQAALEEFNLEWEPKIGAKTRTRIGINTGEVSVGNMGSDQVFDYTVLGDNVNLASRFEGINKDYSTKIIAGMETYRQCSDRFLFRPLDRIQVRGRDEPVEVCELISSQAEGAAYLEWVEAFARARASYNLGRWQEARLAFESSKLLKPDDKAAEIFLGRIAEFESNQDGLRNHLGIWKRSS
jgi:adenylate cyclase